MLNEEKLKDALKDYVPEVRVETYYGRGSDPVEIKEYWNINTNEWDVDEDNAKRGYLLQKIKSKLNKFLKNDQQEKHTRSDIGGTNIREVLEGEVKREEEV